MQFTVPSLLRRILGRPLSFAAFVILLCSAAAAQAPASPIAGQSGRTLLVVSTPDALSAAVDAGPMPGSQRLSLTLTLAPPASRAVALDQFLAALTTPGSPSFHQWITPAQFASSFGATADQLLAVTAWAQSQGLTVDAVSPSATRLTLSGPASLVASAFAVPLRLYQVAGALYFANAAQPSLPAAMASSVVSIDGLSNLPDASITATALDVKGLSASSVATLPSLGATVDGNLTAILTLDSGLPASSLTPAQIAAYTLIFRQASAQGITVLAAAGSLPSAFPASLAEVTAIAAPGAQPDSSIPTVARPSWQAAPGLPADALRHTPDLTAASLSAFAQTLSTIEIHAGLRQGSINPILYSLAPMPGLYAQPDPVAAGTWEAATGLGLVDLNLLAKAFPSGTGAVNVTLSSSNPSPIHGSSFTLSSAVTSSTGGAIPTGTVTFSSTQAGFASVSAALDANGNAVSAALLLPGGTYPLTATYSGDATYASQTATLTLTVQPEPANFALTVPPPVNLGDPIKVVATLTSPSGFGTPAASITVVPTGLPGAAAQTQTLAGANGSASSTFTFTANQVGTVSFQANCTPADQSFTCFTPQTGSTLVYQVTPTVTLSLSTTTPTAGQILTFTIGVTGVAGVAPTGTVQIVDNQSAIATITLPATSGQAALTSYPTHSVKAVYTGDNNYVPANSPSIPVNVTLAATTTTVTATPASLAANQDISFLVTVAPTSGTNVGGGPPTGTVQVTIGSAAPLAETLNGGIIGFQTNGLPPGSYPVQVTYPGDVNYAASSSTSLTLTVAPASGVISASVSPTSFNTGSTATLTVQLGLPNNAQVPANTGFTAVLNGVTYNGSFAINPGGNTATGAVTLYAPIAGSYNIAVVCVANALFTCNTLSVPVTSTATVAGKPGGGTTPTQTTLTSSSAAPAAGQPITLTASVTASATAIAANALSGSVAFFDGSTLLVSAPLALVSGSFVASAPVTLPGSLTHTLTAVYSGDKNYAGSTSPAVSVGSIASSAAITLSASSSSGVAGFAISFTASVTGSTSGGGTPTGSVSFYLAGTIPSLLAKVPLTATVGGGSATFTTAGLPAGTQTVYAVYSGDANFASITSAGVVIGLADYSVSFSPQILNLHPGQTGQTTVTLTPLGNYAGTITFTCIPPVGTSIDCSFAPPQLTGAATTVLTVTTVAAKAQAIGAASLRTGEGAAPGGGAARPIAAALTLAGLLCCLLPGGSFFSRKPNPGRRRRLPALLLLCLGLALTSGLGCAVTNFYDSTPIAGTSGTPLGTSILTINTVGSDGVTAIRHNFSVQVTVQ